MSQCRLSIESANCGWMETQKPFPTTTAQKSVLKKFKTKYVVVAALYGGTIVKNFLYFMEK